MMTREMIAEEYPETMFADGFDEALLGLVHRFGETGPVACYDRDECIGVLMADGMDWSAANEWMDYNVEGSWIGEQTPAFLDRLVEDEGEM